MKKTVSFVLAILLAISVTIPAFAVEDNAGVYYSATAEQVAAELKAWGLFRGVSDTEFDLYREPTRTEALIMLIRVLGEEEKVQTGSFSHPFRDVPEWADPYIGYAYETGLTKGISDTEFGAADPASANMYLTFMLRALGYGEGDFSWDNPRDLAERVGILSDLVDTEHFYRRDVVLVSHLALYAKLLDQENMTLAQKLGIDPTVHPADPVNAEYGLLASYFGVDIYLVTAGVDYINRSLIADGHQPDYRLRRVQERVYAGELEGYLKKGIGEEAFYDFLMDETYQAYKERLDF